MRLHSLLFAVVASAAVLDKSSSETISATEVIQTIIESPWLLPSTIHKSLTHRLKNLDKRQLDFGKLLGGMFASPSSLANAPKSAVPEITELKSEAWEGARRTKIRYGPYRIPPISEKNFQSQIMNVQGMTDTFNMNAKKPCDDKCTILAIRADLEYADGKLATNKDGAWFHHAVLLNSGPNVIEPNCGRGKVENMFMSGNEKSTNVFALPGASIKSGFSIAKVNNFILTTELMNMKDVEQWVWMTLSFDYLEGEHPTFKNGKTVWSSIAPIPSCPGTKAQKNWGPSNLTLSQQPKSLKFAEHSHVWQAPKDGFILSTGGHQHDGGTGVLVFKNDEIICDSAPIYTAAGGHGAMAGMKRQLKAGEYSNNDIPHIDKQKGCAFKDGIPLKAGDLMHIQANYDFEQHPGMKNKKGELDEVMGIVGTLVAF